MKFIAFYLPQFHPIKENDQWWGKGFTEWTNVTKARPLFEGHDQPKLPADLGFYDLRLPEVMIEQSKLAKANGIDAFCYYHYWFNGKLLLEKPLELMLVNTEIDMPFLLCWANENWTRRWDGKEQEILMKQDYLNYNVEEHLNWLMPYFKDERYVKIDNKPVFLIYRAHDIKLMKIIIRDWNEYCKLHGFAGIYTVAANTLFTTLSHQELLDLGFDAIYNFEPNNFKDNKIVEDGPIKASLYKYKDFMKNSLKNEWDSNAKVFPTVFPNWDNTARRGDSATVIQIEDVNDYTYWLFKSMKKIQHYNTNEQFIFINAWNEWAEGAYLEPDRKYGHALLEATKSVKEDYYNGILKKRSYKMKENQSQHNLIIDLKKPLLIWGTGTRGLKTFYELPKEVNFLGFIDSDIKKNNAKIEGHIIYNWEKDRNELVCLKPLILIASTYEQEIINSNMIDIDYFTTKLNVKIIGNQKLELY